MESKDDRVCKGILAGDRAFTGPYGLQLGIEAGCNYSCTFCGAFSSRRPADSRRASSGGHMPGPVVARLIDSAVRLEVEQISVVGIGEPLLHPDALDLFRRIKRAGLRLMVTTNGSLLRESLACELCEIELDILNVSFSAGSPETYGAVHGERHAARFDTILSCLRALADAKRGRHTATPRVAVRFTVTRQNVHELARWGSLAMECGANELVIQPYIPPAFGHDLVLTTEDQRAAAVQLRQLQPSADERDVSTNFARVLPLWEDSPAGAPLVEGYRVDGDFYRHHPCLVGWTYALVLESGEVRPCCYCWTPIGNIHDRSFEEIWFGEAYNALRRTIRSLPERGEAQPGCSCLSGCGAVADSIRTIKRLGLEDRFPPAAG